MLKTILPAKPCPCTSGARYGDCCRPLHRGSPAPSATALMRSRYAAFAIGDVDYLDGTQHPEHADQALPAAERRRGISAFARTARFPGLKIVDAADDGEDALVLFVARVFVGSDDQSFMECSRFRRHEGAWRYLSGDLEDDVATHGATKTIAAYQARTKATSAVSSAS
ncbi:MAG TPA: YchJ family metal-binding protein [Myxococcota bacterium]